MEILGDLAWPLLEGLFQIIVEYVLFPVAECLFEEFVVWVLVKIAWLISKVIALIARGAILLWRKMVQLAAHALP